GMTCNSSDPVLYRSDSTSLAGRSLVERRLGSSRYFRIGVAAVFQTCRPPRVSPRLGLHRHDLRPHRGADSNLRWSQRPTTTVGVRLCRKSWRHARWSCPARCQALTPSAQWQLDTM